MSVFKAGTRFWLVKVQIHKMKTIHRSLLTISMVLAGLLSTSQAKTELTVQVIGTFDYPGAISTSPIGINDRGDITGWYVDSSNVTRGFFRTRSGQFRSINEPNATGNQTRAQKINNSRVISGFYSKADGSSHGYFLAGNAFSEFDVAGANSTYIFGLNDNNAFVGSFSTALGLDGYVNTGGTTTPFSVPGSTFTEPLAINNLGEIGGLYFVSDVIHGFFRDAAGTITAPLDIPGSTLTLIAGLNDSGRMVGSYTDGSGVTHGFLLTPTGSFISIDYPGAIETGLNAINSGGLICGRYTDPAGIPHGFIARSQ